MSPDIIAMALENGITEQKVTQDLLAEAKIFSLVVCGITGMSRCAIIGVMENMIAMKRAGATIIITYHALDVAAWLKE